MSVSRLIYLVGLVTICLLSISLIPSLSTLIITHSHDSPVASTVPFILSVSADSASAFNDDDEDAPVLTAFDDDDDEPPQPTKTTTDTPTPAKKKSTKKKSTVVSVDDEDDVAELLADDDEFVGGEEITKPKKASKKKSKKKVAAATQKEPTIENVIAEPLSFFSPIGLPEYAGLLFIVIYILNYFIGSRKNNQLAAQVTEKFKSVFEEQFAFIGNDPSPAASADGTVEPAPTSAFVLQKESEYSYRVYASGRRFISGMLLTLDLQSRHDLFSQALSLLDLARTQDELTLEFAMNEEDMEPFCFALIKKKMFKKFLKQESAVGSELESMTTPSKSKILEKYTILNELPELEPDLLNERVVRLLSKTQVEAHFISAHFSDQMVVPFATGKKVARFQFSLPKDWSETGEDSPVESLTLLLKLAFYFVDRLGELKLSSSARLRSEARRKKLAEAALKATSKDRLEAQQRRKEEQRKKEKEIMEKDPTSDLAKELLRKKEARDAKAAKKARGANVKVMR